MTRAELLTAVLAEPDVLWAAYGSGFRLAGPWTDTPDDSLGWAAKRVFVSGTVACKIADAGGEWCGIWCEGRSGPLPTREAAEAWCDDRLREAGAMLATGALTTDGGSDGPNG